MKSLFKTIQLVLLLTIGQIAIGQTTFNYKDDFQKMLTKTKDKKDNLSYDKLLKRFNSIDTTMTDYEVLALLIGFTDKPEYKPYKDLSTEREIYKLNDEGKFKEGLELGQKFIKTHPLSVKTIFEIAYSYHKLNQEDNAKPYIYQGQRIFSAMLFSDNGQTIDTPTFALGPADGQDYIHKYVGASIGTMGSGSDKNGNFIDILEAKFEDKTTMNLYFIIQHATNKMFDEKSMEKLLKEEMKNK